MNEKFKQDQVTGRFVPSGKPVMADKPIAVRLPIEVDEIIRAMPDRTEFLRQVISQAVELRMSKSNSKTA
jgi:hypothetical protein